jgi:hypothetical protein
MRSWGDLSRVEKQLFDRIFRKKNFLCAEENFELTAAKINMLCRPLSDDEINRANHILDSYEAGILSREVA